MPNTITASDECFESIAADTVFVVIEDDCDIEILELTEKGDPGPQGIQGTQGPQGIQGIQGMQGEQGPAGARWETTNW